jgi:cytochrome c556
MLATMKNHHRQQIEYTKTLTMCRKGTGMKSLNKAIITATTCMAFSSVAVAADVTPAMSEKHAKAATQYRQAIFQLVKSNMGPLGGMAKGALPFDESVMQTNAVRLEQLATMMGDYLSVDTREHNVDTGAKDAIWENFSDVETKIAALKSAAQGLQTAVEDGDKSAYRNAIGKIGASCKSCHDDYKKD